MQYKRCLLVRDMEGSDDMRVQMYGTLTMLNMGSERYRVFTEDIQALSEMSDTEDTGMSKEDLGGSTSVTRDPPSSQGARALERTVVHHEEGTRERDEGIEALIDRIRNHQPSLIVSKRLEEVLTETMRDSVIVETQTRPNLQQDIDMKTSRPEPTSKETASIDIIRNDGETEAPKPDGMDGK